MAHTSLLEWNYNYNNTRTSQAKLQGHILLHLPRREGEKMLIATYNSDITIFSQVNTQFGIGDPELV